MKIYTVVDVISGVAVGAKSFRSLSEARMHFNQVRELRNLEDDDVQLFEDEVLSSSERRRPSLKSGMAGL